ncbi:MAG: hypothetical protein AB1564_16095, partial [Chloroflexota bacterium]
MKKIIVVVAFLSLFLSSCSLSYRRIISFFTAKDPQELFVRMPVEIVSGYELAQERNRFGFVVFAPSKRVPDGMYETETLASQIVWIGWNDDFIVVMEQEETQKVWRIIDVVSQHVYDCIEATQIDMCNSYDEFLSLRTQLGVPESVVMRDVQEV